MMQKIDLQTQLQALQRDNKRLQHENLLLSRIAGIVQSGHQGGVIANAQGVVEWVNATFSQITGIGYEMAIGQTLHALMYGHSVAELGHQMLLKQLCEENHVVVTILGVNADAESFWGEYTISAHLSQDGQIDYITAVLQDKTLQQDMVHWLQDAAKIEQALMQSETTALLITDSTGVIQKFNRVAEQLLGYDADDVIGRFTPMVFFESGEIEKRFPDMVSGGYLPFEPFAQRLLNSIAQGDLQGAIWNFCHRAHRKFSVSLRVEVIYNEQRIAIGYVFMAQDVSEHLLSQMAQRDKQRTLNSVYQNMPLPVLVVNSKQHVQFFNQALIDLLDCEPESVQVNMPFSQLRQYCYVYCADVEHDGLEWTDLLQSCIHMGDVRKDIECKVVRQDGSERWVLISAHPLYDGNTIYAAMMVMVDVTEHKLVEKALLEGEQRFRSLVERSLAGVYIIQHQRFVYVNPMMKRIFGYSGDEMYHLSPLQIVADIDKERVGQRLQQNFRQDQDSIHYEFVGLRKDHSSLHVEVIGSYMEYDGEQALIGTLLDVSERKQREHQIRRLANYDSLTNLPNRRMVMERLNHALALAQRSHIPVSILYLDLDKFKDINDTLGHDAGDELLVKLTKTLSEGLRSSDTLARLGGDEFCYILMNSSSEGALIFSRRVLEQVSQPLDIKGHQVSVYASIGIATFPEHGYTDETLFKHADIAMYQAKEKGGGVEIFHEQQAESVTRRVLIEKLLLEAITEDQFTLHYQPRIDLKTGDITSLEALIRWYHPEHGAISPGEFISIAEHSGFIHQLGRFVVAKVCQQIVEWQQKGIEISIAINVSVKELHQPHFVEELQAIIKKYAVDGRFVELEITESAVMNDVEQNLVTLRKLKSLGFDISIDDFGTGYSSLNYLKRLPASSLKIDQSFLKEIISESQQPTVDMSIVKSIIALAKAMGLITIAEGVENGAQERFLSTLGCQQAQGFLYCRPLPAAQIEPMLHNKKLQLAKDVK